MCPVILLNLVYKTHFFIHTKVHLEFGITPCFMTQSFIFKTVLISQLVPLRLKFILLFDICSCYNSTPHFYLFPRIVCFCILRIHKLIKDNNWVKELTTCFGQNNYICNKFVHICILHISNFTLYSHTFAHVQITTYFLLHYFLWIKVAWILISK